MEQNRASNYFDGRIVKVIDGDIEKAIKELRRRSKRRGLYDTQDRRCRKFRRVRNAG